MILLLNILILASFPVFPAKAATSHPKIVAKVNQAQITDIALSAEVHSYLRKIGHQELSPFRMAAVEKNALKKLIEEELLYQEGLKLQEEEAVGDKLDVTEAEIEVGVLEIRDRFPSQQAYEDSLLNEGLTVDEIRKGIVRSHLIQKTWEMLSSMSSEARRKRLTAMTKSAVIQVHPRPLPSSRERPAIGGQR